MEQLKHECGVALLRLLKPLEYYHERYGSWRYPLNKLYLLMEKQHNRGQDGAGIAAVNSRVPTGREYILRERALGSNAIQELFGRLSTKYSKDPTLAAKSLASAGEMLMGHLRYSTTGDAGISYVHPFLRRSSWKSKSLMVCGNFNMTNTDEIFNGFISRGQHPRIYADTFLVLETIGNELDRAVEKIYSENLSYIGESRAMSETISSELNFPEILHASSANWDGGYVIGGITGDGNGFAIRDPWGIRPAFYYYDDEFAVLASERPVIQTAFNVDIADVHELEPGQGIFFTYKNEVKLAQVREPQERLHCSFERIYFSRGGDADIYGERKQLGRQLVPQVLEAVEGDLEHTVFSFIPNTAEVAFIGMIEGLEDYLSDIKLAKIKEATTDDERKAVLAMRIRHEKVAIKDIKLRTFIADDSGRDELATHVYDITYGTIVPYVDNLVVLDDSIVRGTTLKQSILKMLDRLHPKKIIIVSSSPQIRYPDYYGIYMSSMNEFIAFRTAIALLHEQHKEHVIDEVYELCKKQQNLPKKDIVNYVKRIYEPFTDEEISAKMGKRLVTYEIKADVAVVYQTIDGLHKAIPNHKGDWYFTGNYPTLGGNMSINRSFISFYEEHYMKKQS
ncbi:amidophosphoribosyltransferase [Deferribacterales bacterium RsTz2092]|nr:amidophosphoribosyltransferase [Deferribacterales bacterium]